MTPASHMFDLLQQVMVCDRSTKNKVHKIIWRRFQREFTDERFVLTDAVREEYV